MERFPSSTTILTYQLTTEEPLEPFFMSHIMNEEVSSCCNDAIGDEETKENKWCTYRNENSNSSSLQSNESVYYDTNMFYDSINRRNSCKSPVSFGSVQIRSYDHHHLLVEKDDDKQQQQLQQQVVDNAVGKKQKDSLLIDTRFEQICIEEQKQEGKTNNTKAANVTFGPVQIRQYDLIIGDNPSTRKGPSITYDWTYQQ